MNELYIDLIAYLQDLAGVPVVRANQNVPASKLPYLTVSIQSIQPTGSFRTGIQEDGTQSVTRSYAFTLDVNFYSKKNGQVELEELVYKVLNGLEDHTKRLLTLNGIAYQEMIQPPTDVSALFGEQWQPRYNVAFRFHTSRLVKYVNSTIDDVDVQAEWRTA